MLPPEWGLIAGAFFIEHTDVTLNTPPYGFLPELTTDSRLLLILSYSEPLLSGGCSVRLPRMPEELGRIGSDIGHFLARTGEAICTRTRTLVNAEKSDFFASGPIHFLLQISQ